MGVNRKSELSHELDASSKTLKHIDNSKKMVEIIEKVIFEDKDNTEFIFGYKVRSSKQFFVPNFSKFYICVIEIDMLVYLLSELP